MSQKYISIFASILIITITSIVLYFYVFRTSDNFSISPIRGSHYDPDIELLSGGMAGGEVPDPHYRWSYSIKTPHEGYPYFGNPYFENPYTPYPTNVAPGFYQNNSKIDRFYNCNGPYCKPIFNPVFDNPRLQDLWMSGH